MFDPAGKTVLGYREYITLRKLIELFSQATGMKAEPVVLPRGQSVFPFPPELQEELDENWEYWKEFGYEGRGDLTVIHPCHIMPYFVLYADLCSWNKHHSLVAWLSTSKRRTGPRYLVRRG